MKIWKICKYLIINRNLCGFWSHYINIINPQRLAGNNHPLRLTERYYRSIYKQVGKKRSKRCVVCSANDKRRESKYECKDCNMGLCFKIYHSQINY